MKAMLLTAVSDLNRKKNPLVLKEIPCPQPGDGELLVKVHACGVCHTELDEIEGRTPPSLYPMIPGHEITGVVERTGRSVTLFKSGDRIGIGWIHHACGRCFSCRTGFENLCGSFVATGRDAPGGYAEYTTVPEAFAFAIPESLSLAEAAPLLCAGAIGYRSIRLTGIRTGQKLGLTGFGASAHLVLKMVKILLPDVPVYVFTRNPEEGRFALELGAAWAGHTQEKAPKPLDAIIDTTPAWTPVIAALGNLAPGGRLVINAIRKESSDRSVLKELDYRVHLWMEKEIKSVANVCRKDISECLDLAGRYGVRPEYETLPLEKANEALSLMKKGGVRGARVLQICGK